MLIRIRNTGNLGSVNLKTTNNDHFCAIMDEGILLPETNRQVLLKHRPKGIPDRHHFEIIETPIPRINNGQVLIRNLYLSVEPAMRGWVSAEANYADPVPIGAVMRSFAVGKVMQSRQSEYRKGDIVTGMFGWQDCFCAEAGQIDRKVMETDLPMTTALGILGLNGLTAYFGMMRIGRPKAGETVVISAAAGSVGSCAAQIARIMGCRTVGIAGGIEKVQLCREYFGVDDAIDYRSENLDIRLEKTCPGGVDIYFDNTSGPISDAVMRQLRVGARVVICGTIAVHSWNPVPLGPRIERYLLVNRARIQGILCTDYADQFPEARQALAQWIRNGEILYREEILSGIHQAPGAIAGLYRGENQGKRLIKIV
ncbi:MAG: NADP-dependent oxidoreductase [Desulfobacula sp.]|jgi:hypothetical protein